MNFSTVPYPENRRQSFLSAVVQWPINHLQTQLSTEDDDGPAEKPVTQVEPTTSRNQSLLLVVQNQLRICRQEACNESSSDDDDLNHAIHYVAVALRCVSTTFKQLTRNDFENEDAQRCLLWTRNVDLFNIIFSLLQEADTGDVTSGSLALLLCTSALERALGHVYLLLDQQVPSLTKDLLASPTLQEILGQDHIWMLRFLLGSPKTLNIRNILWHGFAAPNEIPLQIAHFIFAMVVSLGHTLENNGYTSDELPFRPTVEFETLYSLEGVFTDLLHPGYTDVLHSLFHTSPFIPKIMLPYWDKALQKVSEKKYSDALALVLPQLEHSMRCLFAYVNNCPERTLTAESTVLYTTFDEMLARELPNGQVNRLYEVIQEGYMVALHDILVYPDGPRIRDRFSHGEFDYMKLPRVTVTHVLQLSAAFCILVLSSSDSLQLSQVEPLQSILEVISNYEPIFHPCTAVKKQIQELFVDCHQWPNANVDVVPDGSRCSEYQEASLLLASNLCQEWQDCLSAFQTNGLDAVQTLKFQLQNLKIKTLHRPRQEWEFLCQMKRLLSHCFKSSQQISTTVACRSQMLQRRELRSRQRATYLKMATSLPTLRQSLVLVVIIVCTALIPVNRLFMSDQSETIKHKKLLNCSEWFAENLKSLTDPSKNRWDESQSLAFDYLDRIWNLLKKKS